MAQAFQIQPDNDPQHAPVLALASRGLLALATTVGSNHTLLSAMSATLHGTGSQIMNVGK